MSEEPRVAGGTRRPDGTIRKEVKIRPGYVPQDEQAVYQSVGTLVSCRQVAGGGSPWGYVSSA
jgi:partner of Y14 and mago protein